MTQNKDLFWGKTLHLNAAVRLLSSFLWGNFDNPLIRPKWLKILKFLSYIGPDLLGHKFWIGMKNNYHSALRLKFPYCLGETRGRMGWVRKTQFTNKTFPRGISGQNEENFINKTIPISLIKFWPFSFAANLKWS